MPKAVNSDLLASSFAYIIKELGDDPNRPGMKDTPKRVAKAWREWTRGYGPVPFEVKAFPTKYKGMLARKGIPFQSFCEHHMAIYQGVVHFAYIPNGKAIGLSKIIRLLQHWSARFTIQEDLTDDLFSRFQKLLKTKNVAIVISAFHSCESTRGVRVGNVPTITSKMGGSFAKNMATRDEFYRVVGM